MKLAYTNEEGISLNKNCIGYTQMKKVYLNEKSIPKDKNE